MEPFAVQNIAMLLLMMSKESRQWFLMQKLQDQDVISASEVPGILSQLLVVATHLNRDLSEEFKMMHKLYSSMDTNSDRRRIYIDSVWHELTDYLRVSIIRGILLEFF